jgi:glycosyltransferase involved in cell wall biosynthesis
VKLLWIIPLCVSDQSLLAGVKNSLASAIAGEKHQIESVVGYTGRRPVLDGFTRALFFKIKRPFVVYRFLFHVRILHEVLKTDADVLMFGYYASHFLPVAYILQFLKKSKSKIILDLRTVPVDIDRSLKSIMNVFRFKMALFFAQYCCDGVTCITSFLKQQVQTNLNISSDRVHVLSTAADFSVFDPAIASSIRKKLGLSNRFVLLYHGTLSPNRGIQNVIASVALSISKITNLTFLVVGIGKAEHELKEMVDKLKINKHVIFTGKVPFTSIPDYIKSANLGIIPLPDIDWWNLNSPIKLKEYLAMQLPFVATDIQSHREMVDLCGDGILISDNHPKTISNALVKYFVDQAKNVTMTNRSTLEGLISYRAEAVKLIFFFKTLCQL